MRLIDADALMVKYGNWYTEEGTEEGYIGTVKGIVDAMPTIEPERKKGKWIRIGDDTFSCNKCGHLFIVIQGSSHMNFCPNCNADMRGEQNED